MKIVSVVGDLSADSFDVPIDKLTPYNLQTLYALSNIKVVAQPSNTEGDLRDNCYIVPEDSTVVRVTGTATNFGTGAQAKQRQQMAAGAKLRLVKALKEQVDEIKKAEGPRPTNKVTSPPPTVVVPPPVAPKPRTPTPPAQNDRDQSWETSKPLDVAPMSESQVNAKFTCRYCKQDVPELNRIMHEMGCKRNKTECPTCFAYFVDAEMAVHIDEMHTDYPCPHCRKNFRKAEIASHQDNCVEKPVACQHCERKMAASVIMYHESTCEAKTEKCGECGTYVGMNKMASHLRSECTARLGGSGGIGGGGQFAGGMSERDIMREVERMLPGGGGTSPPPAGTGRRNDPIDLDGGTGGTEEKLSDEEIARKMQQEEYGAPPPPATGGSFGGVGSGSAHGPGDDFAYNPADFDDQPRPPTETAQPTMLGGYERVTTSDEEELSAALIARLQGDQAQSDAEFARGLGGGGGGGFHTGGGSGFRGVGSHGGGRGGAGHGLGGSGGGRGSRFTPPPPPRGGGGGGARESDEEMARRLAQEEWGN